MIVVTHPPTPATGTLSMSYQMLIPAPEEDSRSLGMCQMGWQDTCSAELCSSGTCITSPFSSSLISAAAHLTSDPLTLRGTTCLYTCPRAFSTLRCITLRGHFNPGRVGDAG